MAEPTLRVVSVIAPCRNERRYVEGFIRGVMAQALPDGWRLQLVLADGLSDDGTRDLLARAAEAEPRLRVVDNPQRIVSTGLNLALARADGEVIVRMDLHTEYANDYVAQCLQALADSGADNVGGPWRAVAEGGHPMQQAIAAAFQTPAVAGGAKSRQLDHEGWVDTVYLGCWPRATFERFGGFDESLVRNQDDEHNLRIVRGGGRIWQSPRIRSTYHPRASLRQVFRQYLQYGYWKPFVMKKHGQAASLRHLVPGLFVGVVAVLAITAPAISLQPVLGLLGLYALAVAGLTAAVQSRHRLPLAALARVPAVIAAYHLSYGIGSLLGWWDVLRGQRGRERFAMLTR